MHSRKIEGDIVLGAPQAVVSYDRKHWTRTETEYDERSGNLIIKHTPKYVRPCSPFHRFAPSDPSPLYFSLVHGSAFPFSTCWT